MCGVAEWRHVGWQSFARTRAERGAFSRACIAWHHTNSRLTRSLAAAPPQTGEQRRIRSLFERATHLSLPAKKMKFLFRRWLEYEQTEGDAASVDHVKQRAMDFVQSAVQA